MITICIVKGGRRKDEVIKFSNWESAEDYLSNNFNNRFDYWISKEGSPVAMEYRDMISLRFF